MFLHFYQFFFWYFQLHIFPRKKFYFGIFLKEGKNDKLMWTVRLFKMLVQNENNINLALD